ncbi:MAG: polysaccharide biosynthesis C-terminal domain-containing protein [Nitrososphaerales archaeon]
MTVGAATVATMVINLVRAKIVAVLIGPYGLGITAQANALINTLTPILFLGLNQGITKYLAAAREQGDETAAANVATSSGIAVLVTSLAGTLLTLAFVRPISQWAMQDSSLVVLVSVSLIGVPFAVLYNLGRAFLQGHKEVRAIAVANVLSAVLSFATVIPLIRILGIEGAVINISLTWALNAALYLWFWVRRGNGRLLKWAAFAWATLRLLVRYGGASLVVSSTNMLAILLVRTFIVQHLGVIPNGLYQAVYGLSTQYLTLVTGAMAAYSFAQLSAIASRPAADATRDPELNVEINNNVRLVALVMVPILAGVVLLRRLGLVVFYSTKFLPAAELFPVQAIGDFFFALAWAFGLVLLPLGRVMPWLWINVSSTILVIPLTWVLIGPMRLEGVVVAYAFSQSIQAGLSWWYIARYTSFHLAVPNTWLLARSLLLLVALALLPSSGVAPYLVGAVLTVAWLFTAVSLEEMRQGVEMVRGRLAALRTRGARRRNR